MKKVKKPNFVRRETWKVKRLGEKWRKPRGSDNKMRLKMKSKRPIVMVGYRSPAATRGTHPSGLYEVIVHNMREIEKIDKSKQAAKISSNVGKKLKEQMLSKAKELGIKVLNPRGSK